MSNQPDGTLETIKKLPSVDYLRTIFDYDSDTGLLKWKISTSNRVKAGDIAGYKTKQGYLCVQIENESFYQHRIAWVLFYGTEPPDFIDHKNGCKSDNKISNLRESDRSQNNYNRKNLSNNKSSVKGVSWHKQHSKWYARLQHQKKMYYVGLFESIEEAKEAIKLKRVKLHKEFTNHG